LKNNLKALIEIHFAVFLFGLSGFIGKVITLPPMLIVLGRTGFAALSLLIFLKISGKLQFNIKKNHLILVLSTGVLLAFHWFCFFYSIHISTVAIGLLTFASFPLFVTFMEPLIYKEKLMSQDVILAIVVVFGLILVVPAFDLSNQVTLGILWGILSGFTFALLSLLNRSFTKNYPSIQITFLQNCSAALVLSPALLILDYQIQPLDYLLVPILGIFCTALSFSLFVKSLKLLSAKTIGLIMCLEPLYGIVLAILILNEVPSRRTIIGGFVILSAVTIESFLQSHRP
jgi:drug/metabolite transporter (DMT)-like permease